MPQRTRGLTAPHGRDSPRAAPVGSSQTGHALSEEGGSWRSLPAPSQVTHTLRCAGSCGAPRGERARTWHPGPRRGGKRPQPRRPARAADQGPGRALPPPPLSSSPGGRALTPSASFCGSLRPAVARGRGRPCGRISASLLPTPSPGLQPREGWARGPGATTDRTGRPPAASSGSSRFLTLSWATRSSHPPLLPALAPVFNFVFFHGHHPPGVR